MDDLGTMSVGFAGDLAGLDEAVNAALEKLNSFAAAAQKLGTFSTGGVDSSGATAAIEEEESALSLLEAQINDAKASLAAMQEQAAAGENVGGIEELTAQIADMEAQAEQARGSLAELATQEQETADTAASASGGGIGSMIGGLGNFAQSAYMNILSMQGLAQTAIGLGDALTGPARTAEQTVTAFQTLTGSASAAAAEMDQLNSFAAQTPFQTQAIDNAAEKMLAFGFSNKAVIPDITAIGDALSDLGKGSEANLQGVIDIFGKIQAQGKLTGGDMMQLSTYGIPAWKMLSEQLGVPVEKLQKMVSSGLVPAGTALDGLRSGMEKTFGGGMAKQAETFNGQLSTLQSNSTIAWASFSGPAMKMAEDGLGKLGNLVASPSFQAFAKVAGQDIAVALGKIGDGVSKIIGFGAGLVSFFQHNQVAADLLYGALAAVGVIALAFAITTIPTLVVAFVSWAIAAGAAAVATLAATWPILLIGAIIALVVAGIILAVQHWGQIVDFLKNVWGSVAGFFQNDVIHPIQDAFTGFSNFFKGIWDGIQFVFKGAINGIISGINGFIGFIDSFQIHIPSVGVGPVHTPSFDWNGLGIPKIPLLESGGQVGAGAFIAGESGPELIYTSGATVYNRGQTAAMMGGSGETHLHVYLDSREMAHFLVDAVGQKIVKKLLSQGPVRSVS